MSVVAILLGLGCGMLLAAVSFGLWGGFQGAQALSRGAHAAAWGAAGVLVVGALLAWGSGLPALESLIGVVDRGALEGPVLSLILMAALAIPLKVDVRQEALWSCALLYVPAWVLALAALVRIVTPGGAVPSTDWVTPVRFSLAVCGGLGARALGQSLRLMTDDAPYVAWPDELAYGLTTLLFGAVTLANLWQRGRVWSYADPVLQGGIVGAWLVWSADWLAPRRHRRLRALLSIVAALLLMVTAIKPA